MSRPRRRPRSKTPDRNRHITLPDSDEEAELKKNSRETRQGYRKEEDDRRRTQQNIQFLAKDIIKDIFNQHEDWWPSPEQFLDVFDIFVSRSKTTVATKKKMEVISHDDLIEWAREARKKRKKTLDAARRAERGRISNQYHAKKEEERQKLCKDFGICSAAAFAGMGVAAVVGAPVIATGAAAAVAMGKYRGTFGGRTRRKKTRKRRRKRKSKRKSRRRKSRKK
jgi:hypothetical protein